MALEIERKFLVTDAAFKQKAIRKFHIRQGYLSRDADTVVRIRIVDTKSFLTIKTKNEGCRRNEFEYEIPYDDGIALLHFCKGMIIEKTRYIVPYEGNDWEIDEFSSSLEGIVIAEIELPSENAPFSKPLFIGDEVTGNPLYYNSNIHKLAKNHSTKLQ